MVLDEAYRAFADPEVRPDVDNLLARHPNLLVQRTLSKDFALAGLRVGYGLASAPLVAGAVARQAPVQRQLSWRWPPSRRRWPARPWRAMSVARVRHERAGWKRPSGGSAPSTSPARPISSPPGSTSARLAPALAAAGTVVRSGADLGLPGWARISIGWAPQMAVLRSVLYSRSLAAAGGTAELSRHGP